MEIAYGTSTNGTIGLEWELACVDHATGELTGAAPGIIAALDSPDGEFPQATSELLTNTLEIVSAPHTRVADAVGDLSTMIDRARVFTDRQGVDLMCAGTHPFSQWFEQTVTPNKPRYEKLIDRTQWWGRQLMIWGVHMHVGVARRDTVFPIINGLLNYYPHFQALSASSPYWTGEDTGYASNRAMMFQQLPTAGLPPQLGAWANFEQLVDDLTRIDVIEDNSELRWDVRPSPKWGTVELRFCDGISTIEELGSLAALAQCLVDELTTKLDADEPVELLQPWFVRENKWRAARYGLDADVILSPAGDERSVRDDIVDVVDRLMPTAERLGCADELGGIGRILDVGAGYERQRAVARVNSGDLTAVVAAIVGELRDGISAV
jgi:carboxylate-amine ligase